MDIVPKFLDSALTPVGKEVGERLADLVSLVFTPVIKAKAKRDNNLKLFLEDLNKKVDEIPEDKLQDPPLNIVGPALEDVAKFYHDEEYLRKLFANLIASSMHKDKSYIHPSFIKVIEQLSPDDARMINQIVVPMGLHFPDHVENIFIPGEFFLIFIDAANFKRWEDASVIYTIPRNAILPEKYPDQLILKRSLTNFKRLELIFFSEVRESDYKIKYNNLSNKVTYEVTGAATTYGTSFANACCENPYDHGDYTQ